MNHETFLPLRGIIALSIFEIVELKEKLPRKTVNRKKRRETTSKSDKIDNDMSKERRGQFASNSTSAVSQNLLNLLDALFVGSCDVLVFH